jgi:peptidyl-prolyl cis-trans isomerase SurA
VPPHIANLRDDYQKIQTAALNEKKNKQIEKWFNEAVREVYINIDPEYDYCGITSN